MFGTADVSPHFQTVHNTIIFDTEESKERISELKILVQKRCPVYNLLKDAGVEDRFTLDSTERGGMTNDVIRVVVNRICSHLHSGTHFHGYHFKEKIIKRRRVFCWGPEIQ